MKYYRDNTNKYEEVCELINEIYNKKAGGTQLSENKSYIEFTLLNLFL